MAAFLSGKKTYLVAALLIGCAVASGFGVQIPEWVWAVIGGMGLVTTRAGVGKAEAAGAAVRDLLVEISQAPPAVAMRPGPSVGATAQAAMTAAFGGQK